jgi:hypothetical protein
MAADPLKLTTDAIAAYATPHGSPIQWYDRGEWVIPRTGFSVAYAQGGGATSCALAYKASGSICHYAMTLASLDFALSRYLHADGQFYISGAVAPGIDTMMFACELGMCLLVLEDRLDTAHREHYAWAMAQMGDVTLHNAKWWSNGNINSGYALVLYLAWRTTGQDRFKTAYAAQMKFLLTTDSRSPGCGLVLMKRDTKPDGSDGRGYLTESTKPNGVGYDPEYTQTQLDVLTRLYLVSGDTVALRLMNLLANQLLATLKPGSPFQIDKTGGSRHPTGTVAMTTGALDVLSRHGRKDLVPTAAEQWKVIDAAYRQTFKYAAMENWLKGLAAQVGAMLLDRIHLA